MCRLPQGTTPGAAVLTTVHMNGAPGGWRQGLDSHHMAWLLWGHLAWCPPLALQGHQLLQLHIKGCLFKGRVKPKDLLVTCLWPAQG